MLSILYCFVIKIENMKKLMFCCFHLGLLNDHLFVKELFIRFTVHVFRGRLSDFVCVFLSLLVLRGGCGI